LSEAIAKARLLETRQSYCAEGVRGGLVVPVTGGIALTLTAVESTPTTITARRIINFDIFPSPFEFDRSPGLIFAPPIIGVKRFFLEVHELAI
jgi:hypothetical protein